MTNKETVTEMMEILEQKAIEASGHEKGHKVEAVLCRGCGIPIWRCSSPTVKPEGKSQVVIIDSDGDEFCYMCGDIKFRHPEIFNWIIQTSKWQLYREVIEKEFSKR